MCLTDAGTDTADTDLLEKPILTVILSVLISLVMRVVRLNIFLDLWFQIFV